MAQNEWEKLGIPNLKKFSDVVSTVVPWQITHTHIVNKEIVILTQSTIKTNYGEARLCKCLVDGVEKLVLMGGQVLVSQIDQFKDNLPIVATIVKQGKYYTFS